MKERNLQEFRNLLTRDRCAKYLAATSGNYQRAVHLYTWNTATSAAFYAHLQALEITLRNQIHEQLTQKYGTFWYDHPAIKFKREHRQQIEKAKSMEKGKQSFAPPSNVVAYLGFGFWVVLLSRYYGGVFWHPALHKSFPYIFPVKRSNVHDRLEELQRLRNRIAHHRPIFHMDLSAHYRNILETIGWVSPQNKEWVETYSRVREILSQKPGNPDIRF